MTIFRNFAGYVMNVKHVRVRRIAFKKKEVRRIVHTDNDAGINK